MIPDDDPRLGAFSSEAVTKQITDANRDLVSRARRLVRDLLTPDDGLMEPMVTLDSRECTLTWLFLKPTRTRRLAIDVQPDGIKYSVSEQPYPGYWDRPTDQCPTCGQTIFVSRDTSGLGNMPCPPALGNMPYGNGLGYNPPMGYGGGGHVSKPEHLEYLHEWLLDRVP